ncbi:MAG: WD40 repeat domain-containing protein [Candidatus Bathyarchaeia archaeon]
MRKARRGVASVVGLVFFLVLLVMSLGSIFIVTDKLTQLQEASKSALTSKVVAVNERIEITSAFLNENGTLTLSLTNLGSVTSELARLIIANETDNQHRYFNLTTVLDPGDFESVDTALSLTSAKKHQIRVVTERGNVASFNLDPTVSTDLSLITPNTVPLNRTFTAQFFVTNRDTSNNVMFNVAPSLTYSGGSLIAGPSPSSVEFVQPGSTAQFQWTFRAPATPTTLMFNATYTNAPQGVYSTSTTKVEPAAFSTATFAYSSATLTPPIGTFFAIGSKDNTVRFHAEDGSEKFNQPTGNDVRAVAVSKDGKYIVAGSDDDQIRFFDDQGSVLWSSTLGDDVFSVSLSADGDTAAAGSADGRVYFWTSAKSLTGTPSATLNYTAGNQVPSVSVSGNGQYIVAGAQKQANKGHVYFFQNDTTLLWDEETSKGVNAVDLSKEGDFIVAGDDDKTVRFYAKNGTTLWTSSSSQDVTVVDMSDDGGFVVSGEEGYLRMYNVATGEKLWEYVVQTAVLSVSITSDGLYAAAGDNKVVYFFSRFSSQPLWSFDTDKKVYSVFLTEDGESLVAGGEDGKVRVWKKAANLFGTPSPTLTINVGDEVFVVAANPVAGPTLQITNTGAVAVVLSQSSRIVFTSTATPANIFTSILVKVTDSDGNIFSVNSLLDSKTIRANETVTLIFSLPGHIKASIPAGEYNTILWLEGIDEEGFKYVQSIALVTTVF